jgi:ferric-dicitrate binding protein FerR (iron transport regulator)
MDLDEIQQLIIEEITGTITPEKQQLLHTILAEDPAAFARWKDMHEVLHPGKVADIQAGLQMERPLEIIHAAQQKKRKLYFARVVSIAAVALVMLLSSWYFLLRDNNSSKNIAGTLAGNNKQIQLQLPGGKTVSLSDSSAEQMKIGHLFFQNNHKRLNYTSSDATPQLVTLNIPAGKDYTIVLSDGTEIMLNAASSLQFPSTFNSNRREVSITGEAFLKVAPKAGQPFLVHLPGHTIQVLGTEFNVNTYDQTQIKIALVKGAVKVKTGKDSLLLKPGYQVTSDRTGMQAALFDEDDVLSWRKGIYNFYNTPFSVAANVISRWYGIELIIDDPSIRNRPFTGVIDRNKPVKTFLDNMQATNGLNYDIQGETIHIK